jgi:hypothetical protein
MATMSPQQLLSQITSKAAVISEELARGVETVKSNDAKIQDSFNNTVATQRQLATDAATVMRAQGLAKLQVEDALARTALQFGADLEDTTGLQRQLAERYLSARAEQRTALDQIQQKKSINFMENPLGYIMAQFTVDDDIAKQNAADSRATQAAQQIEETNKLIDARAVAAARLQRTVNASTIEAAARTAASTATLAAEEAARQSLVANSKSVQEIVNLRVADMQTAAAGYDAVIKQKSLEISLQNLKLSQEAAARDAQRLQLSEAESRRAEERARREGVVFDQTQAAGKYIQDMIILGYKTMYPNQPQKWEVPNSPKMLSLISGKVPLDGELKDAFEIGVLNSKVDPTGGRRLLASTPIDGLRVLRLRPELSSDAKVTVQLMTDATEAAMASTQYKQAVAAKNPEEANKIINEAIKRTFQEKAAIVSDSTNPYYLPNIETIISTSPDLKRAVDANEFPVYSQVLRPLSAAGVSLNSPDLVFQALVRPVTEGKIPLNQAAIELATIYRQGQRVNIESKQMLNFGIAPIESYNVKINTGGLTNDTVDMANPNEIMRAMLKLSRAMTAGEVGFGGLVSNPPPPIAAAPAPATSRTASGVVRPAPPKGQ